MNIKQFLLKTAAIIETRGWCQKRFVDDNGCVCITHAMRLATGLGQNVESLYSYDLDAVFWDGRRHFRSLIDSLDIVEWNDAPGRTKKEVLAKLRDAAETAAN